MQWTFDSEAEVDAFIDFIVRRKRDEIALKSLKCRRTVIVSDGHLQMAIAFYWGIRAAEKLEVKNAKAN